VKTADYYRVKSDRDDVGGGVIRKSDIEKHLLIKNRILNV